MKNSDQWLHGQASRTMEVIVAVVLYPLGVVTACGGLFGIYFALVQKPDPVAAVVFNIFLATGVFCVVTAHRLLTGRGRRSDGALLSPAVLRIGGGIFVIAAPLALIKMPIASAGACLGFAAACFTLAHRRAKALRQLEPGIQREPLKVVATGNCLASRQVVEEFQPVGFLYREPPDNEQDSGWRFFSGLEDQTYVDRPENLGSYAVSSIAALDPSIVPLLEAPCYSAFERGDSGEFVQFHDFNFGQGLDPDSGV